MKLRYLQTSILILMLGNACTKFNNNDTLLQIGQYKLSVADYELAKTMTKERFKITQLDSILLTEGYILAYAMDNRYDTVGIVSKKLKYYMYDKAAKIDGFVWNKLVKPNLAINADEIKYAYQKRSLSYSLEILQFPTKTLLNKFLKPDVKVESENDFYSLKKSASVTGEVKVLQMNDCYPLYPFGSYTDKVSNLKKGDVFGPLEMLSGIYLVHVQDIISVKQKAYEEEKSYIERLLQRTLSEKYIWESQKDILSKANIHYNHDAIQEITPSYDPDKREWIGKDKKTELMKYEFHGSVHSYTISDLMEFIRCAPVVYGDLSDPSGIKQCLEIYVQYLYLFDEAQQLNIDKDENIALYKKQYQEKLMVDYYNERNIYPNITVTSLEERKYYDANKDKFKDFESATVSIFKFKDISSALEGRRNIEGQRELSLSSGIKTSGLPNMVSALKNLEIHISDTTNNESLINSVKNMKEGQVQILKPFNDEFWVIYLLSKHGVSLIPFKYLDYDIKGLLRNKKTTEVRDSLIAVLKTKYPLKINRLDKYNIRMNK